MESSNANGSQRDLGRKTSDKYIPELETFAPAPEEKTKSYLKQLKTYFISGKKTGESLKSDAYPIQFAQHQKGDVANMDYPVFYDSENGGLISLYPFLKKLVEEHFEEETSAIISQELPKLIAPLQKTIPDGDNEIVIRHLVEEIIRTFQALDLPEKESPKFGEKIDKFQKELLTRVKTLIGFTEKTAFQILNLQNKLRGHLKSEFLKTLKKVTTGLNELLMLHGDASNLSNIQMDFAEDLISFDKMRDITVSTVSSEMPKSTLQRLKSTLKTLTTAQESYAQGTMTIIAPKAVIQSFELESTFDKVAIKAASENSCHQAINQSKKDVDEFVKTMAALRMGQLMIEQKYNEGLHDPYFDRFDLSYLTEKDVRYLPPTIVIEDSRQLMIQSNDFLTLLSRKSFVKVLGINQLDDLFDIQDRPDQDHLDLTSLAIFRRDSYVFQGGVDSPADLNQAYKKGLEFPGSVFWNILTPSKETGNEKGMYFRLGAAAESRYFPRMEYTAIGHHFAGHQINLQKNHAPEAYFASHEQKMKFPSGIETMDIAYTMADFLALDSKLMETLEIIPPVYQSTNLIPFSEYLSQSEDTLSGKLPFIWLADDQDKLSQAVIPLSWIQKCRNRLEYWSFLQSLSGVNNAHLQKTIEEAKSEWIKAKDTEIEALTSDLREKFEKERTDNLQEAVSRMLYGLLGQEEDIESVLTELSTEEFKPAVEAKQEKAPEKEKEEIKEEKEEPIAAIKEEAWVESEECTSCNDCIDALSSVFKYNENKQAYVHNPKGGTFAQIVKAAEKCPARCIHPGLPQNKKEEAIDKWIKRAEKYN